jgi:hypothetical protein
VSGKPGTHHRTSCAGPFAIPSPHSAGLSKDVAIRMTIPTAQNVLAGLDGTFDLSTVVDREVLRDQEGQARAGGAFFDPLADLRRCQELRKYGRWALEARDHNSTANKGHSPAMPLRL